MTQTREFWRHKTLEQMTDTEWESLCDNCGLCCLVRLEDEDTGEVHETNVICRHYDCNNWQCSNYSRRSDVDHGCVKLTPQLVREFDWLPESCAYRLVSQGKDLPAHHALLRDKNEAPALAEFDNVRQIQRQVGLVFDAPDVVHEYHLIVTTSF